MAASIQKSSIFSILIIAEATRLTNELEALETPEWAIRALLKREVLTHHVIDPNCGFGMLARCASDAGYDVTANDIFDWGYEGQNFTLDFLSDKAAHHLAHHVKGKTVLMNPPFKMSVEFIKRAMELGAQKIVMFCTLTFFGTQERRTFINDNKPSRIYVCGDRATCWRFDVPEQERKGTTSKQFAFFVWEGEGKTDPTTHLIYKGDV